MEKNNEEIKIVNEQDENLENDQLESTTGGAGTCSCDCSFFNSNTNDPIKQQLSDTEEPEIV